MNRELESLVDASNKESKILRTLEKRFGLSGIIDRRMIELAEHVGGLSPFFTRVDDEFLQLTPRPEAVDHHKTYLKPNVLSSKQQEETLGLLDLMLKDQVPELIDVYINYFEEHNIFERLKSGEKFIIPSNHLELPDQGFTLGLISKAARQSAGIDRLENHVTLFIGRLLGYFQLGDTNVIDGILRRAGGVLKTFPVSGSETMREDGVTEEELDLVMRAFRKYSNSRTKHEFEKLIRSDQGHIIMMAGGGSQDHKHENGTIEMHPFGSTTSELLALACAKGATVLPLFVDYGNDASIVEFGEPTKVTSPEDAHRIGEIISDIGTRARRRATAQHPEVDRFKGDIFYRSA